MDEPNLWEVTYTYTITYDRPLTMIVQHPLFVHQQNLEPPPALGDDVQPPIRILLQHTLHHRGTADLHQRPAIHQHDAELRVVADCFADHFLVPFLKNVQWQMPSGHQHDFKWEQRQ